MKKRSPILEIVLGILVLAGVTYFLIQKNDEPPKAKIEFQFPKPYPVTAAPDQVVKVRVVNQDAEPREFKVNIVELRGPKAVLTGPGGMQSPITLAPNESRELSLTVDASSVEAGKLSAFGLSGLVKLDDGYWKPMVTDVVRLELKAP